MSQTEFRSDLRTAGVSPLWDVMANLVTESPNPRAVSHHWPYSELRALLMRAGNEITAEQAERRVLILENPNIDAGNRATDALYAGLQLLLPGEIAPAHRHTQSALRFVLESEGAWTSVDGERVAMEPFDLILTPNWRWHEHGSREGVAIWLDGLDIPTIQHFSAGFAEREGNVPASDTLPTGSSVAAYGSGLRPVPAHRDETAAGLFHYPYSTWRKALDDYSEAYPADSHTGWMMEFTNPIDAGAVMGTISAFSQKIAARSKTRPRRQSAGAVYCGVEGQGALIADGRRYEIRPRDVVAIPSWSALEIETTQDDLVLFSYSDRICHEKLGFWREERI